MRNYQDPTYKNWIKQVKIRDNYRCKWPMCGIKKGLQAHHILPWKDYIGLRYDINNGITLCKSHHKLIYNDETAYAEFFMRLLYSSKIQNKKGKE